MRFQIVGLCLCLLYSCTKPPKFENLIDTPLTTGGVNKWEATWALFFEDDPHTFPDKELPIHNLKMSEMQEEFAAVWLGHSSILLKIENEFVLFDPVFGKRVSPFQWIGPIRAHPLPIKVSELPHLSAVVISHDHHDHLDENTVLELNARTEKFFVPLEVGTILRDWGIPSEKIVELNWWQSVTHRGLKISCTPARHFSGRGLINWNQTLWASWVIEHPKLKVFFGGDTGFFETFSEIGKKHGPFDLTLMPIGAYDELWSAIHVSPEESVQAHKMLKGKLFFPIHWATFDLSRHAWDEPKKRFLHAATDIAYVLPLPGEVVQLKPTTR
jgi:L-ascorbate metabolism protein UlaG (beta-lactamase superfamily)